MDLSLSWAGPHPLIEPAREPVVWAIAPSEVETESYLWSSTLGVWGTWRPFGISSLRCKRAGDSSASSFPAELETSFKLASDAYGPDVWKGSRAWWEFNYEDLGGPLEVPIWCSSIVDALTSIYSAHEQWRDQSYFTVGPAVTASGVRALGREMREQWTAYLPVMTKICQAKAIYRDRPDG